MQWGEKGDRLSKAFGEAKGSTDSTQPPRQVVGKGNAEMNFPNWHLAYMELLAQRTQGCPWRCWSPRWRRPTPRWSSAALPPWTRWRRWGTGWEDTRHGRGQWWREESGLPTQGRRHGRSTISSTTREHEWEQVLGNLLLLWMEQLDDQSYQDHWHWCGNWSKCGRRDHLQVSSATLDPSCKMSQIWQMYKIYILGNHTVL